MLEFSYLVYQLKAEGVPRSTECAQFYSYENIHLKLDLEKPLVFSMLLSSFLPECLLNP